MGRTEWRRLVGGEWEGPFPMGGRLMRMLAETKSEGDEGVAWIPEGDLHRSREKMTVSEERGNEEENDGGREGGEGL